MAESFTRGLGDRQGSGKCKRPLESLGYDYAEHAGVPGHHIFGRGRDRTERTHLVHVVEFGSASWRSGVTFRHALRADESLRAEYLRIKELAATLELQKDERNITS